jgi:hypothetical protein
VELIHGIADFLLALAGTLVGQVMSAILYGALCAAIGLPLFAIIEAVRWLRRYRRAAR